MPAIFPGFEPLGGGDACPRAASGLGTTLAVLVIVVPFCVTVITDGTRLGACVGNGLEVIEDVARVVGASVVDVDVGVVRAKVVEVGAASIVVEDTSLEVTGP